ncbi:MarR family transcriptional regulator [Mycolicibacterium goodii]|uniref:MarR family transcriptional regulator n=3 Tax=Mycolicibacterium goodii TaxID=134601 RepID=A0ABS6HQ48_MYCGD|nr:MarR family transcriptional regulator [Mycolicibacterium goodii]MBU8814484.1 MarR family transcriptional regulator [Mycolicibacterium goodii]MBU8824817.1 MarR family transcriptional regulator [Mycolicibacterium goodii]MBU8828974.1 MarR family transcriptional regulator [Mycolicibacterium goodii]MBU8840317.1 MarR family transcriptional regulator [Mycolicibacterium goodii]
MRAARALVGITAASISTVDDVVTVPQLRVMMMIATRGAMNLAGVAEALQVSPSNASRICDRLLKVGMIDRRDDPADRRNIALTLTAEGQALIDRVVRHRRSAIRRILRQMSPERRELLAAVIEEFATAAGEPREEHRHALI